MRKKLWILLTLLSLQSIAQDCPYPTAEAEMVGPKLSLNIRNSGDFKGLDTDTPALGVLNSAGQRITTIFNTHLIIGAKDSLGNLHLAGGDFTIPTQFDFAAGPLHPSTGMPYDENCTTLDGIWLIYGNEIQQHIDDFADDGTIDKMLPNIYAYPGHGNPHFESFYGYALPDTPQKLAPFFDQNNDGMYDPDNGDYPLPEGVAASNIPFMMAWTVFNDGNEIHTSTYGEPLGMEVQLTAWSFDCVDNLILDNNIFTSFKIINRSSMNYDSLYVGMLTDFDLGCYIDDFFGCIPDQNTIYSYNEYLEDQSCLSVNVLGFQDNPPVQSYTFLNRPINSFIPYHTGICLASMETYPPALPEEYYWGLQGKWRDGTPIIYGSLIPKDTFSTPTQFAFPSHPLDSSGWAMYPQHSFNCLGYSLSSVFWDSFGAGEMEQVDIAYSFHQADSLNHLETVNLVYENTPLLQQMYNTGFEDQCMPPNYCVEDCVWAGDTNKDSLVNLRDILNIGLNYQASGTERNPPVFWYPSYAENWGATTQGVDLKHNDTNGNGVIDSADFDIILYHFGKKYHTVAPPDIYQQGAELFIENQSQQVIDSIESGDFGLGKIKIDLEEEIYGLSFILEYDTTYFSANVVTWTHPFQNINDSSAYLPDINWVLDFIEKNPGNIHYAAVKLDGQNAPTTANPLFRIWLEAKEINVASVSSSIRFKNIKAILHDGSAISIGGMDFQTVVYHPDLINRVDLEKSFVEIFPNPTHDFLTIFSKNKSFQNIEMFDAFGKKVFSENGNFEEQKIISTQAFPVGIYFLKIEMEGRFLTKKIIVTR